MKLMTISQVTKNFGITTRMLRYYDEIGLLPSIRTDEYAYRMYDEASVKRLQQILILRKLRIPLKQIGIIYESRNSSEITRIFQNSVEEITEEILALTTIRRALTTLLEELQSAGSLAVLDMLKDEALCEIVDMLLLQSEEEKEHTMEDLNKAEQTANTLKNVRILYIPPCTVASSHYIGEEPEAHASGKLNAYVAESGLCNRKPDVRMYGFNNPSPQGEEPYGYEFWVTIPEDEVLPEGLVKKTFPGGIYAAHSIKMGDFWEWELLHNWVEASTEYEFQAREPFGMGGCMEEHLNVYSHFLKGNINDSFTQLDLLMPVTEVI